jgi:hypothetical protein
MFDVGDVVAFHSPTVGKRKYHICLGQEDGITKFAFLFVNSETGFKGDCVLEDGEIPGLPISRTDQSVVSFTNITRMGADRLNLFEAESVGRISGDVAGILATFARETKVLNRREKSFVVSSLETLF